MKLHWMLAMLLAAFALPALAQKAKPEFSMSVRGELVIAPDGSVTSWTMQGREVNDAVKALLQKNVDHWRFEPIMVGGKAVTARTTMTLELEAVPQAEGYVMRVAQVFFGTLEARPGNRTPKYPSSAQQAGLDARVVLALKLDPEGKVLAMHPFQTSLSREMSENSARRWRKRFEDASMSAVRDWKYVPGEVIGGVTVESTVLVPILYTLIRPGLSNNANLWQGFIPGPVSPAPWTDASSIAAVDADELGDGEAATLDSRFRLASDVIGKAL